MDSAVIYIAEEWVVDWLREIDKAADARRPATVVA
jgi:hypothetical protein